MLLIIACLLLGVLTGLVPGLHSNTIASVLLSLGLDDPSLPFAMVGMFAVHSIICFIPSIFLGMPEEGTILSVLPGHRMAREGRGVEALTIMSVSAIAALLASMALLPLSQALYPAVFAAIEPHLFCILAAASLLLIIRSKKPAHAFLVFLLAGAVGKQAFSLPIADPFLPMFSGMFAMAAILTCPSARLPEQKPPGKFDYAILRFAFLGVLLGWIADLLPGISSPAQVAAFTSILLPFSGTAYLSLVSSIGVSESVFAFSSASTIGKARIGAIAEASRIVPIAENLAPFLSFFIVGTAFACILIFIFRNKIGEISKINFKILNALLAVYLCSAAFIIDSFLGLALLLVSTALGYLCVRMGVERTLLMGAVIVPTMLLLF